MIKAGDHITVLGAVDDHSSKRYTIAAAVRTVLPIGFDWYDPGRADLPWISGHCTFNEEGVTWCRGWRTGAPDEDVQALLMAEALL